MGKSLITSRIIGFIKNNRLRMSANDMGRHFGFDGNIISRWMRENGFSVSKKRQLKFRIQARQRVTSSTPKIDKFLINNYLTMPLKTMADAIGRSDSFVKTRLRQLNLKRSKWVVRKIIAQFRFRPGHVPANKGKKMPADVYNKCRGTMFKKGNIPPNAIGFKDGDVSIRYIKSRGGRPRRPYFHIRLAKRKWYPLHQYNWEKINGKVTKGMCLWLKDQDSLNPHPDNMELITRAENLRRNSCSIRLTDGYVAQTLAKRDRSLFNEILKDKELIETKRQLLILKRTIKSKNDETSKRGSRAA